MDSTQINRINRLKSDFLLDKKSQALSDHSIKSYAQALEIFQKFCDQQNIESILEVTPSTIRDFISFLSEYKNSSMILTFSIVKMFFTWVEYQDRLCKPFSVGWVRRPN